ncbi:hypothetical protein [Telmatospirillum sp. J64-1]|uniref:hypothetical protein n=1 Tax=Telmatospirillum sp. J64-1 TaxID=2502183 RepID=UPI00115EECDF|nr:hypothetical protein [Telmatospirillum sp. J64-1]
MRYRKDGSAYIDLGAISGVLKEVKAALVIWLAPYEAKVLARIFHGVEVRTAEGWKKPGGNLPQNIHQYAMGLYWGRPFVEAVMAPVLGRETQSFALRLERVRRELEIVESEALAMDAYLLGLDERLASVAGRSAAEAGHDPVAVGAGAGATRGKARRQGRILAGAGQGIALALMLGLAMGSAIQWAVSDEGGLDARHVRVASARLVRSVRMEG